MNLDWVPPEELRDSQEELEAHIEYLLEQAALQERFDAIKAQVEEKLNGQQG